MTAPLSDGLRQRAAAGWAAYERLGLPEERDENWRYVAPHFDLGEHGLVVEPGEPMSGAAPAVGAVIVDGHTVSTADGEGISVGPLADSEPPAIADGVVALHEAFASDGVDIAVSPGVEATAITVDLQAVTPSVAAFPRIGITLGAGASAAVTVVERSPQGAEALVIPRFDVVAGVGARVRLTIVQEWDSSTKAAARVSLVGHRDASLTMAEAGFGAHYSRLHLTCDLVGDGSSANIVGAYFGDGDQTLDYRYFMRHAARSTTSEMFLKGAVADDSRSVFSGLIRIEPEGQKTSAHQTNRNLVLSDGAEAHSVPNLEILADDVRCGHGSAVGPLDEEQRYYLTSRGLDRERADRLQVKGFFEEALVRFGDEEVRSDLRALALEKYSRVGS